MPVPKYAKVNYLGVLIKHTIVADAAVAEFAAVGSGARSIEGRIERVACISYDFGGDSRC